MSEVLIRYCHQCGDKAPGNDLFICGGCGEAGMCEVCWSEHSCGWPAQSEEASDD